jgi:hypothetical protein
VCSCIAFAFSLTIFHSEALHRAVERANDLESQLKASEEARKKAEKDASCVKDLRQRLQVAEDALSNKEANQVECENAIIKRLETQSRRFSSTTIFPFALLFFPCGNIFFWC